MRRRELTIGPSRGRSSGSQDSTSRRNGGRKIAGFFGHSEYLRAVGRHVLAHFPGIHPVHAVRPLGSAGGFSGAEFWRLLSDEGPLCLRAWPRGLPDRRRLAWMHGVLELAAANGCSFLPVPRKTSSNSTSVSWDRRLWELARWMPGDASYHNAPNDRKLGSAMRALARFHRATRPSGLPGKTSERSPSLHERLALMGEIDGRLFELLQAEIAAGVPHAWESRAQEILSLYPCLVSRLRPRLQAALKTRWELTVCHGDLWHDHVLFTADCVTGFIDFGAMKIDCRALDIARLLGSLVGDDRQGWQFALEAYDQANRLGAGEHQLVEVFDQTGILLSGLNWLRWTLLEHRTFDRPDRVLRRVDAILGRLRHLDSRL